jgi:hypothetical protein
VVSVELVVPHRVALSEQYVSEAPDAFDLRYNLNDIVSMTDVHTNFLRTNVQIELHWNLLTQPPEFFN